MNRPGVDYTNVSAVNLRDGADDQRRCAVVEIEVATVGIRAVERLNLIGPASPRPTELVDSVEPSISPPFSVSWPAAVRLMLPPARFALTAILPSTVNSIDLFKAVRPTVSTVVIKRLPALW